MINDTTCIRIFVVNGDWPMKRFHNFGLIDLPNEVLL